MFVEGDINFEPLASGLLLKVSDEDAAAWKFAGIASDESVDTDGDSILKTMLDLSYAQQRGFVNWHHSRQPEDQIGFLTKAELIGAERLATLERDLGITLSKTASIFVEGQLYKNVPKAAAVRNILTSAPKGYVGGVALSIDGVVAKDVDSGDMVKAFVRGVAMTTIPAQTKTLCQLTKTLIAAMKETQLAKRMNEENKGLTREQAAMWLLKQRPHWTLEFAQKVTELAFNQRGE